MAMRLANNELKGRGRKRLLPNVLSQNTLGGTDEYHEEPQSG